MIATFIPIRCQLWFVHLGRCAVQAGFGRGEGLLGVYLLYPTQRLAEDASVDVLLS